MGISDYNNDLKFSDIVNQSKLDGGQLEDIAAKLRDAKLRGLLIGEETKTTEQTEQAQESEAIKKVSELIKKYLEGLKKKTELEKTREEAEKIVDELLGTSMHVESALSKITPKTIAMVMEVFEEKTGKSLIEILQNRDAFFSTSLVEQYIAPHLIARAKEIGLDVPKLDSSDKKEYAMALEGLATDIILYEKTGQKGFIIDTPEGLEVPFTPELPDVKFPPIGLETPEEETPEVEEPAPTEPTTPTAPTEEVEEPEEVEEVEEVKPTSNVNPARMKREAQEIADALIKNPSPSNAALNKITPENVVFVLHLYNKETGRNLITDLNNNGDNNMVSAKNKICWNLATRAKELGLEGIYFSGYQNETSLDALEDWAEKAYIAIRDKEISDNPAIKNEFNKFESMYVVNSKDVETLEKNGRKIAIELRDAIVDDYYSKSGIWNKIKATARGDGNLTNKKTLAVLKQIKPDNVAYVVKEYERLTHEPLAKAIDGELGLDIDTVKTYICKNLVAQAKVLGLTDISENDYKDIDDVHKLSQWIDNVSAKIRIAMDKVVEKTQTVSTEKRSGANVEKTITDHPRFKEAGIKKIVEIRDGNGELVKSTTYFLNGKVVEEGFVLKKDGTKVRVRKLIKRGNTPPPSTPSTNIQEAVPMTIKVPDDAPQGAKDFAKALEKNKARLMKLLNIDNDTFNKLAKLAMAIAEQETRFGTTGGLRGAKYKVAEAVSDTIAGDVSAAAKGSAWSCGMTQIKYNEHIKDPDVKKLFEALGIKDEDDLFNTENSANATVALLAVLAKRIKSQKVQDGVEAARGAIVEVDGWEKVNGEVKKTYNTGAWVNEITEEDILCYYWNGRGRQVINGTMQPESNDYTRNVRKYLKKYDVVEDKQARAEAIKRSAAAQNSQQASRAARNFKPMSNNGALGSIMFMPKIYNRDYTHKAEDIKLLKSALAANHTITPESKRLFIQAVERGEIAFEFGMDLTEVNSLTQRDVDMMLNRVKRLKAQMKEVNFEDGISAEEARIMAQKYARIIRREEYEFRREYLEANAPVYATKDLPPSNVLMTPNNTDIDAGRMVRGDRARRGFVGWFEDPNNPPPVNGANTSAASKRLAEVAQDVALNMHSSGKCMTGFRRAMLEAGVEAANSKDLVEGQPKAVAGWMERHPDMFEEVKFINIGGGKSRQITSTDLPKLPAGYIVIWIPQKEHYNSQPGHICITNGNGGAYADETDNLNWGAYASGNEKETGKGEHGYFRVFRLTDKWKVNSEGKLVFEG